MLPTAPSAIGHSVEGDGRIAAQHVGNTGRVDRHGEQRAELRLAEIEVREHDVLTAPGEREREVGGGRGLAFPRIRARDGDVRRPLLTLEDLREVGREQLVRVGESRSTITARLRERFGMFWIVASTGTSIASSTSASVRTRVSSSSRSPAISNATTNPIAAPSTASRMRSGDVWAAPSAGSTIAVSPELSVFRTLRR